jgi:hypothetical protein
MLDVDYWISNSGPDDVRWEKLEHIKQIMSGGMYPVPPKLVAVKLLEHMLELDRANRRWKRSRSSAKTNGSSVVGNASAGSDGVNPMDKATRKSQTNNVKTNGRKHPEEGSQSR